MGKRSAFFDVNEQNEEENKGIRQQDKFLVNDEKGIVLKKKHALELLKDLKIKMYTDPIKQIHYVDVFKALMKRIL